MMANLSTFCGGFLLPFLCLCFWSRWVKRWRAWGGGLAVLLLIAPMWWLNHGQAQPWIVQRGPIFVDMGLAVGVGIFFHGLFLKGCLRASLLNVKAALLGGSLAGLIAYLLV